MEPKYDSREVFRNESKVVPFWLNENGGEEEENCTMTDTSASELTSVFKRMIDMLPLVLDIDWSSHRQTCGTESCPCGTKFSFPDIPRPSKNLPHQWTVSAQSILSGYIGILYRAAFLFNTPVNVRLPEFFSENIDRHTRVRHANDSAKLTIEYNSTAALGSVTVSPLGQWMLESMEETIKERALLRSSLVVELGALDGTYVTLRPVSNNHIALSEASCSPSENINTLLEEAKGEVTLTGKQRSEVKIAENMLVPHTSTNSTVSIQSIQSSFSKGFLRCDWKGGVPIFLFCVGDDRADVYLASRQKIESSSFKALDYMYLFYSRTSSRKHSRNHSNCASDFMGKMRVSSSLVLNSNRSKLIETEFVLFGAKKNASEDMQSSLSTATKSKGLSKILAEAFRPSFPSKHKSLLKSAELTSHTENFLRDPSLSDLCSFTETASVNVLDVNCPPDLELAAIVVKEYQTDHNKAAAVGGWGLKFLEKARSNHIGTTLESTVFSETGKESATGNSMEASRSVNVIIPADFHGSPSNSSRGPSRLTERWRSHGQCDCGGWDIGCPLTLFEHTSSSSDSLPQDESQQGVDSVDFFMEGSKSGEPALRITKMKEGLYQIDFQSSLSALQSFSIGVAMLHSQTPGLYPKL